MRGACPPALPLFPLGCQAAQSWGGPLRPVAPGGAVWCPGEHGLGAPQLGRSPAGTSSQTLLPLGPTGRPPSLHGALAPASGTWWSRLSGGSAGSHLGTAQPRGWGFPHQVNPSVCPRGCLSAGRGRGHWDLSHHNDCPAGPAQPGAPRGSLHSACLPAPAVTMGMHRDKRPEAHAARAPLLRQKSFPAARGTVPQGEGSCRGPGPAPSVRDPRGTLATGLPCSSADLETAAGGLGSSEPAACCAPPPYEEGLGGDSPEPPTPSLGRQGVPITHLQFRLWGSCLLLGSQNSWPDALSLLPGPVCVGVRGRALGRQQGAGCPCVAEPQSPPPTWGPGCPSLGAVLSQGWGTAGSGLGSEFRLVPYPSSLVSTPVLPRSCDGCQACTPSPAPNTASRKPSQPRPHLLPLQPGQPDSSPYLLGGGLCSVKQGPPTGWPGRGGTL